MFNADTFSIQGTTHFTNQDYAIDGGGEAPWVIVSDGCSGAPMSDVGARLLALSSIPHINENLNDAFCHKVLTTAHTHSHALRLPSDILSATLLSAYQQRETIRVRIIGDGSIVLRDRSSGELTLIEINFLPGGTSQKSAPYYLRYELDQPTKVNWLDMFGGKWIATEYTIQQSGEWEIIHEEIGQVRRYDPFCYAVYFGLGCYDMVAVLSDGISAFTKDGQSIPAPDVVSKMFSYRKNYRGEFVKRRCKRAFQQMGELGWQNNDDVSVGVIVSTQGNN